MPKVPTVSVTYDRRGLSRSKLDDLAQPPRLETHSDDAHRLLAALTTEPVFVLGNSIGALIGLDLVARHSEQVRTLVAHEPPALELLPDAERTHVVRAQEDVEETYRREGVAAAMRKGLANIGLNFEDREPDVVLPQPTSQRAANLEFFRTHDAPAAHRYRLDIAALQAGTEFVEFPGGHNGHVLHPRAFAARLRDVLGDEQGK